MAPTSVVVFVFFSVSFVATVVDLAEAAAYALYASEPDVIPFTLIESPSLVLK